MRRGPAGNVELSKPGSCIAGRGVLGGASFTFTIPSQQPRLPYHDPHNMGAVEPGIKPVPAPTIGGGPELPKLR